MRAIILLMILTPALLFSQNKTKFEYRQAPQTGELVCIAGVALLAANVCGLFHKEPGLNKVLGITAGAMIFAGVVIDINSQNKPRFIYRRKRNKTRIRIKY